MINPELTNSTQKAPIDIIIPIFNGYEYLKPLFTSISKNSTASHTITVINDCSTDSRVTDFLSDLSQYQNNHCISIIVHTNQNNLGFVKSVNLGISITKNHFVILNSDTEVPSHWIQRLFYSIYENSRVASVTPLTNSGTICSFPNWLHDNPLAFELSVEEIDDTFNRLNYSAIETPTGVGFCMAMNRNVVNEVGAFDAKVFNKGYGEENDWCMRALNYGYINLITPNLFVYHKHGGSFGAEKINLIQENSKKLIQKHPSYNGRVAQFISQKPFEDLFVKASILLFLKLNPAIVLTHSWGGGADHFLHEHLYNDIETPYILVINSSGINAKNNINLIINKQSIFTFTITDIEVILSLLQYSIDCQYYINHIITFENTESALQHLVDFFRTYDIHPIYYIHDYFLICPTINLLNDDFKYCGLPMDHNTCNNCLYNLKTAGRLQPVNPNITTWRSKSLELLKQCNIIYGFSDSSINIFKLVFPEIATKIITYRLRLKKLQKVIHKVDFSKHKVMRIGVLGVLAKHKGLHIIEEINSIIRSTNRDYKIILIGESPVRLKHIKTTGSYRKTELPKICNQESIDLFIMPAICPETYSYTTDEIMSMGYPIFTFNLGAPAERVKSYMNGTVVDNLNATSLLQAIDAFVIKNGYKNPRSNIMANVFDKCKNFFN